MRELTLDAERRLIDRAINASDERSGHRGNPSSRLGVRARLREPGGAGCRCSINWLRRQTVARSRPRPAPSVMVIENSTCWADCCQL
jgi:hypothetical protein